jgi:hypothetical protein
MRSLPPVPKDLKPGNDVQSAALLFRKQGSGNYRKKHRQSKTTATGITHFRTHFRMGKSLKKKYSLRGQGTAGKNPPK